MQKVSSTSRSKALKADQDWVPGKKPSAQPCVVSETTMVQCELCSKWRTIEQQDLVSTSLFTIECNGISPIFTSVSCTALAMITRRRYICDMIA